jgi:hypothetical protein
VPRLLNTWLMHGEQRQNPTTYLGDGVLFKANYETAMMSTTKIKVSLGPIGPEPFGP